MRTFGKFSAKTKHASASSVLAENADFTNVQDRALDMNIKVLKTMKLYFCY